MSCSVCQEALWKYKCPGCLVKTCSLPCVNLHKKNNNCNGKRDKTAYVRKRDFNDSNLLNDYRFLEDVARTSDSAQRDQLNRPLGKNKPSYLNRILQQARKRQMNLYIMPKQFTKRKLNCTWYSERTKKMQWTVEWSFPHVNAKYRDKKVEEDAILRDVLAKYVEQGQGDPVIQNKLKPYVTKGLGECKLYMKIERRRANSVRYYALDLDKTLQDNLTHKTVVEYPVIQVVLKDRVGEYKTLKPDGTDYTSSEASSDSSDDSTDSSTDSSESDSETPVTITTEIKQEKLEVEIPNVDSETINDQCENLKAQTEDLETANHDNKCEVLKSQNEDLKTSENKNLCERKTLNENLATVDVKYTDSKVKVETRLDNDTEDGATNTMNKDTDTVNKSHQCSQEISKRQNQDQDTEDNSVKRQKTSDEGNK